MLLKPYHKKDLCEIIKLFYNTVHFVNAADYTPAQLNAWAPASLNKEDWATSLAKNYTLVAWQNGQITGFADIEPSGYLNRLYIHKDFQHKGIATLLTDALEEYAFSLGIKRVYTHASITAKPFFIKRGYHVKEQNQVKRGEQILINYTMEKQLIL
ncbi:MAG: GNAT family N-acetyltransferase [Oscillospiraceae bacterium]